MVQPIYSLSYHYIWWVTGDRRSYWWKSRCSEIWVHDLRTNLPFTAPTALQCWRRMYCSLQDGHHCPSAFTDALFPQRSRSQHRQSMQLVSPYLFSIADMSSFQRGRISYNYFAANRPKLLPDAEYKPGWFPISIAAYLPARTNPASPLHCWRWRVRSVGCRHGRARGYTGRARQFRPWPSPHFIAARRMPVACATPTSVLTVPAAAAGASSSPAPPAVARCWYGASVASRDGNR